MASLKSAARWVLEEARDGIAWIALWKEGRSWASETFYLDYNERTGNITLGYQDDMETLENIIKVDPNAIIVNSYVHNLGVMDCYVTLADLSNALRWQYDLQRATLTDLLECVVQPK